jgi:hypothetical protein
MTKLPNTPSTPPRLKTMMTAVGSFINLSYIMFVVGASFLSYVQCRYPTTKRMMAFLLTHHVSNDEAQQVFIRIYSNTYLLALLSFHY